MKNFLTFIFKLESFEELLFKLSEVVLSLMLLKLGSK